MAFIRKDRESICKCGYNEGLFSVHVCVYVYLCVCYWMGDVCINVYCFLCRYLCALFKCPYCIYMHVYKISRVCPSVSYLKYSLLYFSELE